MLRHRANLAAAAALALPLALIAAPRPASAQGEVLPALSNDHPLMLGDSRALGDDQAQMRVSFDGAFRTGTWDAERSRSGVDDVARTYALSWDASFDMGHFAEIGGRLRLSYELDSGYERLGPDMFGAGIRVRALDDPEGPWLTVGLALAQELTADTARLIELDTVLGTPLGARARLDLSAYGQVRVHNQAGSRHGAVVLGPLWWPNDWLTVAFDVQGRYGRAPFADDDFWDLTAAVRLAADLGNGHELALSGWRTLYGQSVDEETVGLLQWRVRWRTDGGLLQLDNDADELVPSAWTETRDEGTPSDDGSGIEPGADEPSDDGSGTEPRADEPSDDGSGGGE